MTMLLELLDVPVDTRLANGRVVSRYERLAFEAPSVCVGGAGCEVVLPAALPEERRELSAELGDEVLHLAFERTRATVRVIGVDTPPAAWPVEVVAGGAASEAALEVLADALLELNHPLGRRLRASKPEDEARWLAHLWRPLREATLDLTWQRGLVRQLVARSTGAELLGGLAEHALTHLLQQLVVVPTSEVKDVVALLEHFAKGMPWLESLTVHSVARDEVPRALRAFSNSRALQRAFPRLSALTLPALSQPAVLLNGVATRLERGRPMMLGPPQVVAGVSSAPLVYWRGCPMLSVASALKLNGLERERPSVSGWLIPLCPGDVFEVGGVEGRLVELGASG